MYCRHCGVEISDDVRFCTECGGVQSQLTEEAEVKKAKRQGWRFVRYLLGAIIIGVSFGGVVLGFTAVDEGSTLIQDEGGDLVWNDDNLALIGIGIVMTSIVFLVLGGILIVKSMKLVTY